MFIVAIDPGTEFSARVVLKDGAIYSHAIVSNSWMLNCLHNPPPDESRPEHLAIEVFEARGMAIGNTSIRTILWTGRFIQAWQPRPHTEIARSNVKLHLCGTNRAKDSNIRASLCDRWGLPGTKGSKGATYGIKSHEWAALAVATYFLDTYQRKETK